MNKPMKQVEEKRKLFLMVEFQLIDVEGMMERNNHHVIIAVLGKNELMLKLMGKLWWKNRIFTLLSLLSTKEKIAIPWLADMTLSKCPSCTLRGTYHLFLPKMHNLSLMVQKQAQTEIFSGQHAPRMSRSWKARWSKSCSRLQETKEMCTRITAGPLDLRWDTETMVIF